MALTTVRPEGMGFNTGRRNLIINGAMQVAQRGTSSTSLFFQTVDRFNNTASTDATITQSQTALTSGDPYNDGFRNVYRHTVTSASSSPASSHYLGIQAKIEAQNMANSGWQYASSSAYVTFSFWVKSSVAGTYSVGIRTLDGTAQGYSFDYTLSADTWKKVTHTIPGNSNITINDDNGEGFRLAFWIYLGGDYTTSGHTDESWAAFSTSSQTGDFAQNWMTTASATFDITGVQLELGENASDFEHRSFAEEWHSCQRYCTVYNIGGGNVHPENYILQHHSPPGKPGHVDVNNRGEWVLEWPVKRAAPTLTFTDGTNMRWGVGNNGVINASANPAMSVGTSPEGGTVFQSVASGITLGSSDVSGIICMWIKQSSGNNPKIVIDAEL